MNSNPTQSSVILNILTALRGKWVSMPDLAHASGGRRISPAISKLRKAGYVIETQLVRRPGGKRMSRYRLVEVAAIHKPQKSLARPVL
jgi:biotin operon repressor